MLISRAGLKACLFTGADAEEVVPEVLASVDAVEALEAALAARSAAEPELAPPGPSGLMSPAVQGMILLNISAALFGSNQVLLPVQLKLRAATSISTGHLSFSISRYSCLVGALSSNFGPRLPRF